jgi:hypothetical protein
MSCQVHSHDEPVEAVLGVDAQLRPALQNDVSGVLAGHEWFSRWNKAHQIFGEARPSQAAPIFSTFNVICSGV